MRKITKVPNGPLIKKKGPFKGSTLKTGGRIKKAQNGEKLEPRDYQKSIDSIKAIKATTPEQKKELRANLEKLVKAKNTQRLAPVTAAQEKRVQDYINANPGSTRDDYFKANKLSDKYNVTGNDSGTKKGGECKGASSKQKQLNGGKNGIVVKKAKAGGMIKRADGSYSKRGLWDNIRANKGSGKKPTKQMLQQERKIKKAQTGGSLGTVYTGPAKTNPGVLKAKADKMKANANISAYKKKIKSKK
jgi:hypothetical protein